MHGFKSTVFDHGWLNLGCGNPGIQRANSVFIEKNPHLSEPTQFKPVSFKGQLYVCGDLK